MASVGKLTPATRVVVTGANRGLGLELTRQLLARGDRVIAGCRNPGRALNLTELAAAHPGHLHTIPLDLGKQRSIAGFAREAGMVRDACDVLVNCAGILVSGERFGELSPQTFTDSWQTNALGPLLLTQAFVPMLASGTRPRVINVSSELGSLAGTTHFHSPSYAMSKAALNMATRLLAAELAAQDVVVVSLHPGWVRTDMGGPNATLGVAESVRGMLRIVDALVVADNGAFLDHRGETLDW
ncbi:MAG: SDR family oxidoreductase [Rudaea sp.]